MTSRTLLVFLLAGCGSNPVEPLPQDGATYWPVAEWRRATPEQVGLDASKIAGLVQRLRGNQIPFIHSLLVVRQGYLAVKEYFNGSTAAFDSPVPFPLPGPPAGRSLNPGAPLDIWPFGYYHYAIWQRLDVPRSRPIRRADSPKSRPTSGP
jgi:hypothetical protein